MASLPTSGSVNSEPGTEALVELVRKVVEEVLDTKKLKKLGKCFKQGAWSVRRGRILVRKGQSLVQ
ncbi:hypothetical protein J1N35_007672 [Gossypium stocksii]|uniref:Uncharacterized protein n=1 Tax=Gossypium stocksii TaxID=47602 RepID=A0A9D3W6I4_9ROSI|nr:hypothetical protein J1N35_007672 [Gossypium stocksii]